MTRARSAKSLEEGSSVQNAGSDPIVSILTPAWNASAYIDATMKSVVEQTYSSWEWLIVDDGSTDNTCEIVSRYTDPRIRLIRKAHSGLPAAGRNAGLELASGKYIAFLDSDDVWLPEKLALQVALLEQNEKVGLVFSPFAMWYSGEAKPRRTVPETTFFPNPGRFFRILCFRNQIGNSTVLLRRSLLQEYGKLDEDPAVRGCEDYELWIRLSYYTDFAFTPQALIWYRIHQNSVSSNNTRNCRAAMRVIEKTVARFPDASDLPSSRQLDARWQYHLGRAQLLDGIEDKGRKALARSLWQWPFNSRAWVYLLVSFLAPGYARRLWR